MGEVPLTKNNFSDFPITEMWSIILKIAERNAYDTTFIKIVHSKTISICGADIFVWCILSYFI